MTAAYYGLCEVAGGAFNPYTSTHRRFLRLVDQYGQEMMQIPNLDALGSNSIEALNGFLTTRGLEPQFRPPLHYGVATSVSKYLEWLTKKLNKYVAIEGWNNNTYLGVEMPKEGTEAYFVEGATLNRLFSTGKDSVWVYMPFNQNWQPVDVIDLTETLYRMWYGPKEKAHNEGIIIPALDINLFPQLDDLMVGMELNGWTIDQVFQQFILKITKKNAIIKVGSGAGMTRGGPLCVNQSFGLFGTSLLEDGTDSPPYGTAFLDYDLWTPYVPKQ